MDAPPSLEARGVWDAVGAWPAAGLDDWAASAKAVMVARAAIASVIRRTYFSPMPMVLLLLSLFVFVLLVLLRPVAMCTPL
jgi:hypothetical protein